MKKVAVILAVVVTLLVLGTSAAYAAQDSLPGETLYPVKLGTEQVMMLLSRDEVVKAERALSFTERRIGEIEALVAEGRVQDLGLAVEKYGYALNMALAKIERARNRGLATQNITALVAEATARHLSVLDTVYDTMSDATKAVIAQVREISEKGRQNALAALAKTDTVRAAEMNLAAMEGRLSRVRAKVQAGFGSEEAVEDALQQFEDMARFGQEISQIAEETGLNITEMAELVTEVTSVHLQVLAELYEEVPEEAKQAVERAMEESFRGYEMIIRVLMGSDAGYSEVPVIPEGIRQRMEDILGWTNAPKIRIPTGGSPRQLCPCCRH
jgi:formate dehydrogenase maturation protein FdhE